MSDASTTIHFYEAVLATGSILVWHFYMVIFDPDVYPMERAWLTGKVSADHLRHTRPSYFRRLTGDSPSPESLFGDEPGPDPRPPHSGSGSPVDEPIVKPSKPPKDSTPSD